jgi:hypothetical protein
MKRPAGAPGWRSPLASPPASRRKTAFAARLPLSRQATGRRRNLMSLRTVPVPSPYVMGWQPHEARNGWFAMMGVSAMRRFAILFAVAAVAAAPALTPAQAQMVQYQYTPPPPIVPLPSSASPSYGYSGLPSPESTLGHAGHSSLHRSSHHSTRYVQTHHGRVVAVPPGPPGQNTFSDRVLRCNQAASQAGIGASRQGAFTAQCAN